MSFHLATVNDTHSPTSATDFRPLRLGGAEGIIARYVASLGAAAEAPWQISESAAVEMAGGKGGSDLMFFLPIQTPRSDGHMEIHRLQSLHGVCTSDRTDLVCHLMPLVMRDAGGGAKEIEASGQRVICESLSLAAGTTRGRWVWTDSPMTLGAMVVGGKCSGGCSSPPAAGCCGNC
jgi:hypothetical protein